MRYIYTAIIGTVVALSSAQVALACPVTSHVSTMSRLDPISQHYVKAVLDRVNDGMATIPSNSGTFADQVVFRLWSWYAQSAVNSNLATSADGVSTNRSLKEQTSCLRIDTQILESRLEELRCELNTAFGNGDGQRIFSVRYIMSFLQQRINDLRRGALDPAYTSTGWGKLYLFDNTDTVVCLEQRTKICSTESLSSCASKDGRVFYKDGLAACIEAGGLPPEDTDITTVGMCPFSSNYLPPTSLGYGCDIEAMEDVLAAYPDVEPFKSEYDALEQLVTDRNAFISLAEPIKEQRELLDEFMGNDPLDLENFGASLGREHKQIQGCIQPTQLNADTGEFTLDFNPLYSSGATFTEPRGPFNFGINQPKISRLLLQKVLNREQARALPSYLQSAYQNIFTGDSAADDLSNIMSGIAFEGLQLMFTPLVRRQSGAQALQKAEVLGVSQDMLLQIQESYKPLRDSIGGLSRSAGTKDEGIRLFGINFAWYLRRSCTDRPCNETLDRVLKILFEDDCFPYTDGSYKDVDSFERCKSGAGL